MLADEQIGILNYPGVFLMLYERERESVMLCHSITLTDQIASSTMPAKGNWDINIKLPTVSKHRDGPTACWSTVWLLSWATIVGGWLGMITFLLRGWALLTCWVFLINCRLLETANVKWGRSISEYNGSQVDRDTVFSALSFNNACTRSVGRFRGVLSGAIDKEGIEL